MSRGDRIALALVLLGLVAFLGSCAQTGPSEDSSAADFLSQSNADADCAIVHTHLDEAAVATEEARKADDGPVAEVNGMANTANALNVSADEVRSAELSEHLRVTAAEASFAVDAAIEWLESPDRLGPGEYQVAVERTQLLLDQLATYCR